MFLFLLSTAEMGSGPCCAGQCAVDVHPSRLSAGVSRAVREWKGDHAIVVVATHGVTVSDDECAPCSCSRWWHVALVCCVWSCVVRHALARSRVLATTLDVDSRDGVVHCAVRVCVKREIVSVCTACPGVRYHVRGRTPCVLRCSHSCECVYSRPFVHCVSRPVQSRRSRPCVACAGQRVFTRGVSCLCLLLVSVQYSQPRACAKGAVCFAAAGLCDVCAVLGGCCASLRGNCGTQ